MGNCKSSNQSVVTYTSESSVGHIDPDNNTIPSNTVHVGMDIDDSSITTCSKYDSFSLENIDFEQIQFFSFEGIDTMCKVIDAYDGDTCTVVFIHPTFRHAIKTKVRCLGYDSPEMKLPRVSDLGSKQEMEKMEEERNKKKKLAVAARDRLLELCTLDPKGVRVVFGKDDKYGRPLASFYLNDGKCVNSIMVNEGHGYAYYGGKKQR